MKLHGRRILLTGAAGGIGMHVASAFAAKGATLILVDRPGEALSNLAAELERKGASVWTIHADLLEPEEPERIAAESLATAGGVDVLVNLAGVLNFTLFQDEDPAAMERLWRVNVLAPARLTRALLPQMLERGVGRIVNIGSVFGSIGSACFASYSASKFAMRGLSQALRRELHGTGVGVTYVSPRYTKTPINAGAVSRMATALNLNMDEPEHVAALIVRAVESGQAEMHVGFPESFFVRVNAVLPRLVDGAVRKQDARVRAFAKIA